MQKRDTMRALQTVACCAQTAYTLLRAFNMLPLLRTH
jgi:hypothetical protein